MSFVPLSRSQLEFIAEEFWPGGGEDGDGRDLYGVAKHHGVWREETSDADLIAEALHPADADYYDRHRVDEMDDERFEKWLAEDEEDNNHLDVLDAQWLAEARAASEDADPDDNLDGKNGPDTLDLVLTRQIAIDPWCVVVPRRWNEGDLVPGARLEDDGIVPSGPGVATAIERFTQDGVRKQSLSAERATEFRHKDQRRRVRRHGPWLHFDLASERLVMDNPSWNGRQRFDSWKRHREAQYRTRHIDPRILDRAA